MAIDTEDELQRDQQRLAAHLSDFIGRWAPKDYQDRREFEMQTYYLFQRAGDVARAPVIHRMSQALSLAPQIISFSKKEAPNG